MKVLLVLLAVSFLWPQSMDAYVTNENSIVKGRVLEVVPGESIVGSFGEMEVHNVTVRLLEKPYQDQVVMISNLITDQPYYDLVVESGDRVLIQVEVTEGLVDYYLVDFAREQSLMKLSFFFVLTLIVIGGIKGLKALLSIMMMGLVIFYVLLPLVLNGYNPIVVTVSICSFLTVLLLLFIGGVNRKTLAAMGGTVGGLVVAGVLSLWAGQASYLTGLSSSEAQMLQFMEGSIDFRGLLLSGIIIGALGAILDVGMSVSSSMEQVWEANPRISCQELMKRGLRVGRDVLGTMSNTLILAYLGTSMPLLLLFQTNDVTWQKAINLDLMATEVVRAMAGSIGLAFAVPITVVFAGVLLQRVKQDQSRVVDD